MRISANSPFSGVVLSHRVNKPHLTHKFPIFDGQDDTVDTTTEMARWFVSGMTRTEVRTMAAGILQHGKMGEFLIRDKAGDVNCYALSAKGEDGELVSNLRISGLCVFTPIHKCPSFVLDNAHTTCEYPPI